jgi:hypothetical protein
MAPALNHMIGGSNMAQKELVKIWELHTKAEFSGIRLLS